MPLHTSFPLRSKHPWFPSHGPQRADLGPLSKSLPGLWPGPLLVGFPRWHMELSRAVRTDDSVPGPTHSHFAVGPATEPNHDDHLMASLILQLFQPL